MGEPIDVGRGCARCGEQVRLHVHTDNGTYTDDLSALLKTHPGDKVVVEAHCGCSRPRIVALRGAANHQ